LQLCDHFFAFSLRLREKKFDMFKFEVFALAIACLVAVAVCDSREDDGGSRYVLRLPSIRSSRPRYQAAPAPYAPAPYAPHPSYNSYGDNYDQPAKYQFAYQAVAGGQGGYGGGYGSGERGYGGNYGPQAEFGHAESRDGDYTKGKYFVQLPDGRLQTVDYYVDGYSGYVAKVSYDGQGGSEEARY
jgi:hypothetical protein